MISSFFFELIVIISYQFCIFLHQAFSKINTIPHNLIVLTPQQKLCPSLAWLFYFNYEYFSFPYNTPWPPLHCHIGWLLVYYLFFHHLHFLFELDSFFKLHIACSSHLVFFMFISCWCCASQVDCWYFINLTTEDLPVMAIATLVDFFKNKDFYFATHAIISIRPILGCCLGWVWCFTSFWSPVLHIAKPKKEQRMTNIVVVGWDDF